MNHTDTSMIDTDISMASVVTSMIYAENMIDKSTVLFVTPMWFLETAELLQFLYQSTVQIYGAVYWFCTWRQTAGQQIPRHLKEP
jgi:hypothetical protein